jgi:hypothetical protein
VVNGLQAKGSYKANPPMAAGQFGQIQKENPASAAAGAGFAVFSRSA